MDWYTLRVISGKEQKIREIIKQEVERNQLSDTIQDILVPTENKIEMKKVSWPTFDELRGAVYVVLTLSLMFAVFLFIVDLMLNRAMSVLL